MKGGRLHRPEPQVHPVAAPAPAPAEDWGDGSWTVDCSCGVTFDDGEEMVSCDDCSVWVHTRCARYVRGVHTSFSCHNCRSKRAPSSADEAEVAELLAELPTHRPPPHFRRWAEVPLPTRVHVHGLPGGGDSAMFHGAPAFSATLWRSTGYVPKRFGFRYHEFPSWADDKDNGADALFALAREKRRETSDSVPIGGDEPKEKHYIRSLSCRGKKIDGGQHAVPSLIEAKKQESDIPEDRCLQREGESMSDTVHEDHYAETNMASSDLQSVKTKNNMDESLEHSGEKKCLKEIPGMLDKSAKDHLKLEASAAEEEVHSGSIRVEVTMHKQQADAKGGLKSGIVNSAGPNKMNDMRGLQKQLNLTSSLQDIALLPDVQKVQSESQIIKRAPGSQGNDTSDVIQLDSGDRKCYRQGMGDTAGSSTAQRNLSQIIKRAPGSQGNDTSDVIQLDSGDRKCYRQGMGDTAGSSTAQRNLSKSTYVPVCCEQSKSETILMHTVVEHPNSLPGDAKICTSFSGTTSTPCELPQLMDKEPSSTGNTVRLAKKELVSPTDIKHESAKFSEESSQQVTRCSEKVQPKSSIASAPKPYQESIICTPTVKPRLPVSKEQLQKATTTGGTPTKSFHEVPLLQSRNKATGSSSSQRKDKIHQRIIHFTQEASNNSTSTELRASDLTASLSDEQLALLLHQQLNSSPRVPRVPRCHQAAGSQMLHTTGASVFSKRSSGHGGRDNATTNSNKRRKGESDSLSDDVLQTENMRPERNLEEGSADLHQEDLPRGKRKARKRRRVELKGRRVRDTRKRSNIDSSSEDAGATLSDSSSDRNDTTMEGMDAVNQEDSCIAP